MITADHLSKRYDGFTALDDVSSRFPRRDLRDRGAQRGGQDHAFKDYLGLITPTSGDLSVNGIDVVRDPVTLKETLGYLPEESRLYETMTAEDYLAFFGEIYGIDKEEITLRTRQPFCCPLA